MTEQMDLELDKYPLHLSFDEWRSRRLPALEEQFAHLSGREILLRLGREDHIRNALIIEQRKTGRRAADSRTEAAKAHAEARAAIPLDAHISRRIAAERIYSRTKQADLARALGIPQATMSDIERGKRPATAAELVLIAEQLGCPLETFVRISAPSG